METFFEERGKPLRFRSAANGFAQLCSRRLLSPFSRKPPFYVEGSFPREKDHAWVAAPAQWADLQRTDGSARAGTWPGLSPPCQPSLPALPGPECQALQGCPVLSDVLCWQSVFPLLWGRAKQAEKGPGLLHLSASWLCGFAPGAAAVCSSLKCPLMSGHKCPFEMSVCFLVSYWGST